MCQASQVCLEKTPLTHVVGFSNGGWITNKLFAACKYPSLTFVGIAAGGVFPDRKDLAESCGHLHVVIGEKDKMNNARAQKFCCIVAEGVTRVTKK